MAWIRLSRVKCAYRYAMTRSFPRFAIKATAYEHSVREIAKLSSIRELLLFWKIQEERVKEKEKAREWVKY